MTEEEAKKAKEEEEKKRKEEEARKKEEIRKQEEAEAEEEKKRRQPAPDPNPRGQDVTKALLDEWDEWKKETGWLPKSKRPTPDKPVSEKRGECCILYPHCLCERKAG